MNIRRRPGRPLREILTGDARELAPLLLGAVLTHESRDGPVSVRLTEVEAYLGPEDSLHPDPGSHTFRGPTRRATPPCSGRPGTCTSTSPTACTTAPTSSAGPKARPPPCCCGPARSWTGVGPCAAPAAHVEDARGPGAGPGPARQGAGTDDGGQRPGCPGRAVPAGASVRAGDGASVPVPGWAYPAPAVPTSMPGVSG